MVKPVIALDADGVLLDFHLGYAGAWQRAFGTAPRERDALAYWPMDRWDVERLDDERRAHFRKHFDDEFWTTLPAISGALGACHRLHEAGFDLVCVSALDSEFEAARLRNLRNLGFPIECVIATGNAAGERSPKADAIAELGPRAFVDDYLPYFRGVGGQTHRALVERAPNGSPNTGDELTLAHSVHADLAAFAEAWLASTDTP
ncbi:MAG: HAD family hydrolase [Pseudomonadota bacterium]|nr:HAD family hydrolase [Pseudomonadota bacterium]